MSDEQDDQPEHPFQAMIFGALPQEVQAQMQAQQDRQQMAIEVYRHEINEFFQSLNVEQTGVLRRMMVQFGGDLGSYYVGVLTMILELKFNVCGGCGKNHDEDFAAAIQENIDPPKPDEEGKY